MRLFRPVNAKANTRAAKLFVGFMFIFLQPVFTRAQEKPFVLGITETIHSLKLEEDRVINVYLPEGYRPADSTRYPVIYLLDGSADEDFIHIVGLVQFNSFPWVATLKKSIVVGIANIDRRRDFTFPTKIPSHLQQWPTTGHSDRFIDFIENELQPYIANKYNTSPDKMIIGQSLGGLLAAEILLKKPQLFNRYVIVSPSIWWDDGSLLGQPVTKSTNRRQVYIAAGKEGLTPAPTHRIMEDDAKKLADKIKKAGGKELSVYFDFMPAVNHGNILHQAVQRAFDYFEKTDRH